ncbi:MAG: type VI secretion system baseplate subunit TssG [Alphaproteobacteria bacterium]|nr:MAG: type VI secretion system baseplate subunit TssG [Alphaproteobacteria bacterium]
MARSKNIAFVSVYEDLALQPNKYTFLAAVKLLRLVLPVDRRTSFQSNLKFYSNIEQRLLGPDIASIQVDRENLKMVINSFGIDVLNGPLPRAYMDKIIENVVYGDGSLYDFLSIYNNRLSHLLYETHKKFKVSLNAGYSDQSPYGSFLKSVAGAYEFYPYEKTLPLRSLMSYARLYWCRSGNGLRVILNDFFKMPTGVTFCTGQWNKIPENIRTKIGGVKARYQALGKEASLGSRFWDQENKFNIQFGPLKLKQYSRFLKSGDLYPMLCDLVRFYKKKQQSFDITLEIEPSEVTETRLGQGPALGWTSWLKSKDLAQNTRSNTLTALGVYNPSDLDDWYAQHQTLYVY